jgi:hypothetical protein
VTSESTRVLRSTARRGLATKHRPKGQVRAEINVTLSTAPVVDTQICTSTR